MVGRQPTRNQADAAREKHDHHDGIEEARRLEIDLQVHQDPGKDNDEASE
jgi:hypothetical protein